MSDFWARFVEESWEQRSTVFSAAETPTPEWMFTPDDLFRVLVDYNQQLHKQNDHAGIDGLVRFYIGVGDWTLGPLQELRSEYLPLASDGSMEGYHERVSQLVPGQSSYGLVMNQVNLLPFFDTLGLRGFLRGLLELVGLPAGGIKPTFFLGNYPTTPFSVHIDTASVLAFPIIGRRRMRLWTREYVREHPEVECSKSYDDHLEDSILLEGAPGDVLYWTSNHYHTGESQGEFFASLNVGLYRDGLPLQELLEELGPKLLPETKVSQYPIDVADRQASAARIPRSFQETIAALRQVVNSPELEAAAEKLWMARVSSDGVASGRSDKKTSCGADDRLQGDPQNPILWSEVDGKLRLATNGLVHTIRSSAQIVALVQQLNSGELLRVGDLTERFSDEEQVSPRAINAIISLFLQRGSLRLRAEA